MMPASLAEFVSGNGLSALNWRQLLSTLRPPRSVPRADRQTEPRRAVFPRTQTKRPTPVSPRRLRFEARSAYQFLSSRCLGRTQ